MKKIISFCLLTLLTFPLVAQQFNKAKMDQYFDAIEESNKYMGTISLAQNGKIIYTRSIGDAILEGGLKANADSKYRIGSISKTFTAVLVMKAVEEGKLTLDTKLEKFFPKIKNAKIITIENLLNHRSGIYNFTNDPQYLDWNKQPKSESQMLEIISKYPTDFYPDSTANYSNSNYVLLSYILEKVYKESYADILMKKIINPAGLKYTHLGSAIKPEKNECLSYKYNGKWQKESETDISIPMGAGGIVSTTADLIQFSNALFGGKLLKKASVERMKILKDGYGLGLFQIPFNKNKGYGHTGGIDGFSSALFHFDDGNFTYAITSNGNAINTNDIAIAVMSNAYGLDFKIPEFKTYQINVEDLNKYVGIYENKFLQMKLDVRIVGNSLEIQATDQEAMIVDPVGLNEFRLEIANANILFFPEEDRLVLKQGGAELKFKKVQ